MTVHAPIETTDGALPRWAIGLTVLLFLVGGVYLASNLVGENPPAAIPGSSAPPGSAEPNPEIGASLVGSVSPACTSCHGPDLAGSGPFPSLIGVAEGPKSENLQQLAEEHPDDWIALWIDGTTPETEGIDRMGMPQYGDQLTPEQIESIVAYLRSL